MQQREDKLLCFVLKLGFQVLKVGFDFLKVGFDIACACGSFVSSLNLGSEVPEQSAPPPFSLFHKCKQNDG